MSKLINAFKRNHRRKTMFAGKLTPAYNVPGTPEAGQLAMLIGRPDPLTYSVVVRDPNSWTQNKDGSNREYEITAHCGHHHKTIDAAQACKDKLTAWYCNCGERSDAHHRRCSSSTGHTEDSTSARWYHACIEDSNGQRIDSY